MSVLIRTLAAAALLAAGASAQATNVGVSVEISQPGVYGRVDIGRFPQPQVVVQQPVIIAPPRVVMAPPQPVYMWVPPGHQRHWRRHCGSYNACGVPVFFVEDGWYRQHVHDGGGRYATPDRYREDGPRGRGRGRGEEHDHGRGHRRGGD